MKKYNLISFAVAVILALSSCASQVGGDSETLGTPDTPAVTTDAAANGETDTETQSAETEEATDEYIVSDSPIEPSRNIEAEYAALLDVDSSLVLYEKGGIDTKIYPASTTKLITALVALKHCSPDTVFTAGKELELVKPGSSLAYILRGHKLKLDTLIAGMLMKSGNDAAYVVAAGVGAEISEDKSITPHEAVEVFIDEMNEFARENGMTGTHFTCPDGFHDDEHYTTMRDMFTVAKLSVQNDVIMKYTKTVEEKFYYVSGENITWTNTNNLINPNSDTYYKYATGLKTGTTGQAGNCLLATAEKDGRVLVACIFRHPDSNGKFSDAKTLFSAVLGTR